MTNELTQMLTEKEVCDGGLSEKVCYDFAEELFGFDSANVNMVWIHSFMTTLSLGRSVLREPVAVVSVGRRKPGKYATEKSVKFRRELASLRFLLGLLCHAIIYCSWHRVQMRLFRTTEKRPRWDETQLQRATFFVHYAFFFGVRLMKNIIHLRRLWKCIVLSKVYSGKGIKIVF